MSLPLGGQSVNKYAKEGGYLSNLYQQETNAHINATDDDKVNININVNKSLWLKRFCLFSFFKFL